MTQWLWENWAHRLRGTAGWRKSKSMISLVLHIYSQGPSLVILTSFCLSLTIQTRASGRRQEKRPGICPVGRPYCCLLARGTPLIYCYAYQIYIFHKTSLYLAVFMSFWLFMAQMVVMLNTLMSLTSCGWVCQHGTWQPAVPTWRVEPSCQLCQTQRSSGRLASATLCTDSNSAWPSRRWSRSPARLHRLPPER